MLIRALFVILAFAPSVSHAEWKVVTKVISVDSKNPDDIAVVMPDFIDIQNQVVARELTHPSKIVVTHFQGEMDWVKWENDAKCTVPDPDSIPSKNVIPSVLVEFYFVDSPGSYHANMMHQFLLPPCKASPGREKSTKLSHY